MIDKDLKHSENPVKKKLTRKTLDDGMVRIINSSEVRQLLAGESEANIDDWNHYWPPADYEMELVEERNLTNKSNYGIANETHNSEAVELDAHCQIAEVTVRGRKATVDFIDKSSDVTKEVTVPFKDNLFVKNNRIFARIFISDKPMILQVDSAADKSILSLKDYDTFDEGNYETYINDTILRDVQGNVIAQPRDPVLLSFTMANKPLKHPFYVIDTKQSLLGADFIHQQKMSVYYVKGDDVPYFTLGGLGDSNIKTIQANMSIKASPRNLNIFAKNNTLVKPGSNDVEVDVELPDGIFDVKRIGATSALTSEAEGPLSYEYLTVSNGKGSARVHSVSTTPVVLEPEQLIAEAEVEVPEDAFPRPPEAPDFVDTFSVEPMGLPAEDTPNKWEERIMSQDHVPQEYRRRLIDMIKNEVPEVLSVHDLDVGTLKPPYDEIVHEIRTTDDKPVRVQPYRLDPVRAAQLESIIQRLVKYGFLTKQESPYGMSCFVIKRKMGDSASGLEAKLRLISDARGLNKKTVPDVYPFFDPTEIFADVAYAKPVVFSSLDIALAFNHLKLSPDAQRKAAILVPGGCYTPTRLTMGLRTAPSSFNLLMSRISEKFPRRPTGNGLPDRKVCCHYADDALVFSRNMDEHLADLEAVLRVFAEAGVKLDIGKIHFARSSVSFLGRTIDAFGVSPQQKHLDAIEKFPVPKDPKSLMAFFGLTLWVSPSYPNYNKETQPLRRFLQKDARWDWTPEDVECFKKMRSNLSRMTKLYHIDHQAPLYAASDASDYFFSYFCYQIKSYTRKELEGLSEDFRFAEIFSGKARSTQHPVLMPKTPQTAALNYLTPVEKIEGMLDLEEAQARSQELHVANVTLSNLEAQLPLEAFLSEKEKLHFILPVAYGSHTFNKTARNWHTLEKEAYSLVFAAKDLTKMVLSTRGGLYLVTDSSPLTWLVQTTTLARGRPTKLVRWLISLYECPFQILVTHTRGMSNLVADGLSRPYSIAWKVIKTADGLKPITVATPFPIGAILTLEDLQNYVKSRNRRGELLVSERELGPNKYLVKTETAYIREIDAKTTNKLVELLSDENIMIKQRLDPKLPALLKRDDFYKYAGLAYKRRPDQTVDDNTGRVYLPAKLVGIAFALNHYRNHLGSRSLAKLVAEQFYFEDLYSLAQKFTVQCHLCAVTKSNFRGSTKIKVESFSNTPKLSTWSIDVVMGLAGPDKISEILVCVEMATRFKLFFPSPPNKSFTSEKVASILEEKIFTVFGKPETMTSDNGSNLLVSTKVSKLLQRYDVHPHLSVRYHPRSHGTVERQNLSLINMFKTLVQQTDLPFNSLIASAQYLLNTKPHTSLGGYTPQHYMFGIDAVPGKRRHGTQVEHFISKEDVDPDWKELYSKLAMAVEGYHRKQEKERQRRGGRDRHFTVGEYVYVPDRSLKLKPKINLRYYTMPYRIQKVFDSVLLVKSFTGIEPLISYDDAKHCPEREAQLFADLPPEVQVDLGEPFTYEQLNEHMEASTIPDFYKPLIKATDGPAMGTRSKRLAEKKKQELEEKRLLKERQERQQQLEAEAARVQQEEEEAISEEDEPEARKQVSFELPE